MAKTCPNCKSNNSDTSEFCKNCGHKLGNSTTRRNKQSNGKLAIGLAGICCIGLILIIAIAGMGSSDKTTTTTNPPTTSTDTASSTPTTDTTTDSSDDKFEGLNHPSEVETILDKYDFNGDDKISFLADDGDTPEYATWALDAGMDPSDAKTLTYLFDLYDANGDGYWSIKELDDFYDGYYNQ